METLGQLLKERRIKLCLYQKEVAKHLGITTPYYNFMEHDKVYSYDPKRIQTIAKFLNISTEEVRKHIPEKR